MYTDDDELYGMRGPDTDSSARTDAHIYNHNSSGETEKDRKKSGPGAHKKRRDDHAQIHVCGNGPGRYPHTQRRNRVCDPHQLRDEHRPPADWRRQRISVSQRLKKDVLLSGLLFLP